MNDCESDNSLEQLLISDRRQYRKKSGGRNLNEQTKLLAA